MGRLIYFAKDFYLFFLISLFLFAAFIFSAVLLKRSGRGLRVIITSIFFFLFIFSLIYSGFELYFRYVYDASDGLGFLQVNKKWQERHVVFNSTFSRDRDFTIDKRSGEIRIAAIGDSLTFGAGIKNPNDRFSDQLEKKLRNSGKDASVYNFGIPGIDTTGEIDVYKNKVRAFKPEIIVWQYYLNDIQMDNSKAAKIFEDNEKRSRLVLELSNRSYFFDFLYWRLNSKYARTFGQLNKSYLDQYADEATFSEHKKLLSEMLSAIRDDNRKVVVIIFPLLNAVEKNYPAADVHQKLSDYFRSENVEVIDLLADVNGRKSGELVASRFDAHPNEFVHNLAAEKLYDSVLKLLEN